MTAQTPAAMPKGRFVPTLTEVVTPLVLESPVVMAVHAQSAVPDDDHKENLQQLGSLQAPVVFQALSALDATVEALLPKARAQLREALQTVADELVNQQLVALEEQLRTQLRSTLKGAIGLEKRELD